MDVFLVLLFVILFLDLTFLKNLHSFREKEYISQKQTKCIKGFSACGIMLVHLAAAVKTGVFFPRFAACGSLFVALFFFYSGYGIMYQYKDKGEDYLVDFPQKKMQKILLPWVVVALVSPIYYALGAKSTAALEPEFKIQNMLEQLGEWVPNGWYIFVILLFELSFYVLARLVRQRTNALMLGCTVVIAAYILIMHSLGMGDWWYCRCHCFLLGMIWCDKEEKLLPMFKKHFRWWWTGMLGITLALFVWYMQGKANYILVAVMLVGFVILVQLTCMKVKLENVVLEWLGNISMEIYLTHGFVLGIFRCSVINISQDWMYGMLTVLGTIGISILLRKRVLSHRIFQFTSSSSKRKELAKN